MSPIEHIAEGIKEGNWETVCEGYERLTGESLPCPTTSATNEAKEALGKIANIVSNVLCEPILKQILSKNKKKSGRPKGSGKKTKKTPDKDNSSINLDDKKKTIVKKEIGGTRLITNNPDPEEVIKNKEKSIRANINKVKLERQPTKTFQAECNECEQSFESNRPDGELGQKCPKCLKKRR
ncbi:hypothetical protein LCGC14_0221570 [marine sediment metagenome]|uniref:Uncharacterized protein n=1 Tax=marine sediment metagenome TaxID=412755 RepID=A0A0F9UI30_9ZZZZ